MTKSEFNCPFCQQWTPFVVFLQHMDDHKFTGNKTKTTNGLVEIPKSIEEMKRRFEQIGLYEER